ncbi:MAG: TolC family protein [Deltaproteobacteria bacterium]|jgi:NodT family efflux transporter outer membrane factor (OMF) lipoprotein|nr:TolC family protein [Deltaproteobacteria bacterium]
MMKTAGLMSLSIALLAVACARVQAPDQNLAERLSYDSQAKERYRLDPQWWKIYGDRRLDRLVEKALENNIDLAKAALSITRALYQARQQQGGLLPQFTSEGGATASKNIKTGGPPSTSVSGNLRLSYEVDLWGKLADGLRAQEWEYLATLEDREAVRLTLVNGVVDLYYHLAYLNDALKSTETNLENYRALERNILVKREAGKVAIVEPAQARQSVLNAENTIADLEGQIQSVEQSLRDLLNLGPGDLLDLACLSLSGLEIVEVDLDIPLSVLANRPDLKAAEFRLRKALKNVDAAEKGWLPSISLGGALESSGPNLSQLMSRPTASGSLSINLPFLQWNTVFWNLRLSETDFEGVRLDFEKTLTTALNEVSAYVRDYERARRVLSNNEEKQAFDLSISQYYRQRYESGAAELSDWLGAQNTLNSSRLATLNSRYQVMQSENMVYKAMAGRYVDAAEEPAGSGP